MSCQAKSLPSVEGQKKNMGPKKPCNTVYELAVDVYKCIQTISRWINIGGKLSKSVVLYDLNSLCI